MKKVVVFLFGVMILFTGCDTKQERVESTVTVVVERVEASDNYARLPYVGTVEEESSTSVSFTGMGVLNTLAVNEGQPVRKGQLLAVIDETQARSMLATTKAALDQALDAQARMKQLHDNQSLPDIKWAEIESKVQQAQSAYDIAKKNLEDCRIYAPVSGLVGAKIMDVGETVLPTEPVLTILSIDRVKVRVSIPESEIAGITAETPTQVSVDALDGETFQGGKIEKGVSADPLTHTYDIRISMPNPEHKLLPGMVAKVTMDSSQEKAIVLPVMAVQQATDKSLFVWSVKEKHAHRQPVSIGQVIGNSVVIASGLSEGEFVIVEGYQKVGEGSLVNYDIKGKTK
ncbi:MAG: efflux RND transporter periplasmic adaptor subunit [Bacteroidaceae bacterium]|nr:efflux RND transporter periplasmic adaptor subunit [Bacteroidaceae bacterium]